MRSLVFTANIQNISANSVAVFKFLSGNNLITTQDSLCFTNIQNNIAKLDSLNRTVDNGADFFLIFFKLLITLGITNFLHNNLFCGLSGNTAKINRRKLVNQKLADFNFWVISLGIIQINLSGFVFDFNIIGHHFPISGHTDSTALAVDMSTNIMLKTIFRTRGFLDGNFHCLKDIITVNIFLPGYSICNQNNFGSRHIFNIFHFFLNFLLLRLKFCFRCFCGSLSQQFIG